MNDSVTSVFAKPFSHIYVESAVKEDVRTKRILSHFHSSTIVECKNWKDLFCRSHQNPELERKSRSLILARGNAAIYPGAKVCQSFGNAHFYYTSCVRNCIYDCEYCYLQGMYQSAHMVMFTDLSDTFSELDRILSEHPAYVSVSYDTDLLALEPIAGYLAEWCDFLSTRPDCTVEVRTKCASVSSISALPVLPNMIFAFTVSPDPVIQKYEHFTPDLSARLRAAKAAIAEGRKVRLCFDPMIRVPEFERIYREMFTTVFSELRRSKLLDASVGVFRISKEYLKTMRDTRPCAVTYYPYTLTDGVYHYDRETEEKLLSVAAEELSGKLPPEKIFTWGNTESEDRRE